MAKARSSTAVGARILALAIVAAALGAAASCSDPVHDSEVAALGGETDIPQGEYHRAGQPCGVCHGQEGPAKLQFSLAGTVFQGPDCRVGAGGAKILIIDSTGNQPGEVITNCVGNFEIANDVFAPQFPILAWVQKGDTTKKMMSHVSRETACNQCHKDPNSDDAPGAHLHERRGAHELHRLLPVHAQRPHQRLQRPDDRQHGGHGEVAQRGRRDRRVDLTAVTPTAEPAYIWTSPGAPAVQP